MLFLSRRIKEKPDAHQFQNYARKEWLRKFVRPIVLGLIPVLTFIVIYGNQQHIWASQEDMTGLREHLTLAQETPEEVPTESGPPLANWQPVVAESQDVRAFVLDRYFHDNRSPLYGTGSLFVEACDTYGAPYDCVVVAAIARAETDLCKYHTSATYYNCWGFGGGGAYRIYFSSWRESIFRVTDTLVNNYGIEYMIDPSKMERVFCGNEPGCTNWGNRVKFHMKIIDEYPLGMGLGFKLTDLKR